MPSPKDEGSASKSYELWLWHQRPHIYDQPPDVTAKSTDGTFTLALDEMDRYCGHALGVVNVGRTARTAKERLDRVKDYLKRITPVYRRLTGKKPRGVPFPIYVRVVAEHHDGRQKAGLAHSYLIEVPMKKIEEFMTRSSR